MKYKYLLLIIAIVMLASLIGCSVPISNDEGAINKIVSDNNAENLKNDEAIETPHVYELPYFFSSEKELSDAVKSKLKFEDVAVSRIDEYYRPNYIPDGVSLEYIAVKDFYVALRYKYNDIIKQTDEDPYYLLEWFRTMTEGSLEKHMYRTYASDHFETFKHYYIVNADIVQSVYWEQDGKVFHAVTPSDISLEELEKFCNAEKVVIEK